MTIFRKHVWTKATGYPAIKNAVGSKFSWGTHEAGLVFRWGPPGKTHCISVKGLIWAIKVRNPVRPKHNLWVGDFESNSVPGRYRDWHPH